MCRLFLRHHQSVQRIPHEEQICVRRFVGIGMSALKNVDRIEILDRMNDVGSSMDVDEMLRKEVERRICLIDGSLDFGAVWNIIEIRHILLGDAGNPLYHVALGNQGRIDGDRGGYLVDQMFSGVKRNRRIRKERRPGFIDRVTFQIIAHDDFAHLRVRSHQQLKQIVLHTHPVGFNLLTAAAADNMAVRQRLCVRKQSLIFVEAEIADFS